MFIYFTMCNTKHAPLANYWFFFYYYGFSKYKMKMSFMVLEIWLFGFAEVLENFVKTFVLNTYRLESFLFVSSIRQYFFYSDLLF